MAQDRMDPLGGLLGAGLLDAVRSAEPPVLLRSWEFPPGYRTLVRELFDCFLAGQRSAFVSDAIHGRSGRCAGDGTSRDRRHRVHVRSALPPFVRLLGLFHLVTPLLLLWAIWRLGYDKRGWKVQTLACWILVPINYFWRPEHDVNWARGPFFREQHVMPGLLYLVGYLVVVPLVVYYPTHLVLEWWARGCGIKLIPPRSSP